MKKYRELRNYEIKSYASSGIVNVTKLYLLR
jgi:hypothetical protein